MKNDDFERLTGRKYITIWLPMANRGQVVLGEFACARLAGLARMLRLKLALLVQHSCSISWVLISGL